MAENPSRSLHKVSEIYDRIAFAGVGKYNEFDQLRVAGVHHADIKGYQFSREDVDARSLANLYAQYLGKVFTHEMKPLEVEILVAEVGADGERGPAVPHRLRRDGRRRGPLHRPRRGDRDHHRVGFGRRSYRRRFGTSTPRSAGGSSPPWPARTGDLRRPPSLEVAVLARSGGRRAFRRLGSGELAERMAGGRRSGLPPGSAPTTPPADADVRRRHAGPLSPPASGGIRPFGEAEFPGVVLEQRLDLVGQQQLARLRRPGPPTTSTCHRPREGVEHRRLPRSWVTMPSAAEAGGRTTRPAHVDPAPCARWTIARHGQRAEAEHQRGRPTEMSAGGAAGSVRDSPSARSRRKEGHGHGASSGSRTSTGSPARCAASAG